VEDRIDEVAGQLALNCMDSEDSLKCLHIQLNQLRADLRWSDSAVDAVERRARVVINAKDTIRSIGFPSHAR
jgi:hypothetical protein